MNSCGEMVVSKFIAIFSLRKYKRIQIPTGQCRIKNSSKCSNWLRFWRPRAVLVLKSYLLHYILDFFSQRSQYFAKFAIRRKRRFSVEHWLCPETLVWISLYSYVTKGMRLPSAVLLF